MIILFDNNKDIYQNIIRILIISQMEIFIQNYWKQKNHTIGIRGKTCKEKERVIHHKWIKAN